MSVAAEVLNQASTLRLAKPVGTPAPDISWTAPVVPFSVMAVSVRIAPATPQRQAGRRVGGVVGIAARVRRRAARALTEPVIDVGGVALRAANCRTVWCLREGDCILSWQGASVER
jgi:hypothetical protein